MIHPVNVCRDLVDIAERAYNTDAAWHGTDGRMRHLLAAVLNHLNAEHAAADQAEAEALADQTLMRGLTVKDGAVNLELLPPREIAAVWVHCARGMLDDAPNYSETRVDFPQVSMEVGLAGEPERYALIVQRVGKLTPHEARRAAEARADQAEATVGRLRGALISALSGQGCGHPGERDDLDPLCGTCRAAAQELAENSTTFRDTLIRLHAVVEDGAEEHIATVMDDTSRLLRAHGIFDA